MVGCSGVDVLGCAKDNPFPLLLFSFLVQNRLVFVYCYKWFDLVMSIRHLSSCYQLRMQLKHLTSVSLKDICETVNVFTKCLHLHSSSDAALHRIPISCCFSVQPRLTGTIGVSPNSPHPTQSSS